MWNCTWFSRTPSSRHVRRPRQDFICFSTDLFFETLIPPVISTLAAVQRPTHAAPRRRFTACAGATAASHMRRCRRDEAVPSCVGGLQRQLILLFLRSWFLSSSFSFASPGFPDRADKWLRGGWRKRADLNITDLRSFYVVSRSPPRKQSVEEYKNVFEQ